MGKNVDMKKISRQIFPNHTELGAYNQLAGKIGRRPLNQKEYDELKRTKRRPDSEINSENKTRNMAKNIIRLTEGDLHRLVKESVNQVLTEMDWKTYMNAARKWADRLHRNPAHPKRKSSIKGHENSKGDHDIPTDNRLRAFKDAARDAFDRDYGFNRYGQDRNKGSYQMSFDTDNIGSKGYYDSIGTETKVPDKFAVTGKTANGDRTKTMLKDRFNMDSIDGRDKYPSKRHQAYIGFNGDSDPRDAVEPGMDKWDYMDARNKGNQEILDYVNGDYDFSNGKWNLNRGGFSIYSDDGGADADTFRPHFCYADGKLESDLGSDIFSLDSAAKEKMLSKDGMNMKPGQYKCNYNGKPCTLYVSYNTSGRGPSIVGLCCYDDDKESREYIKSKLGR